MKFTNFYLKCILPRWNLKQINPIFRKVSPIWTKEYQLKNEKFPIQSKNLCKWYNNSLQFSFKGNLTLVGTSFMAMWVGRESKDGYLVRAFSQNFTHFTKNLVDIVWIRQFLYWFISFRTSKVVLRSLVTTLIYFKIVNIFCRGNKIFRNEFFLVFRKIKKLH